MLQPILSFLKKLNKNNNKAWFDAHREEYERVKKLHHDWVAEMLKKMAAFDPGLAHLQPKDCTYRINRDVRFSKDKRPYKNNMGAYINALGKKSDTAGYYIHLQPGNCFVAAGIWMPTPAHLAKIRQEIDYNLPDFRKILQSKKMKNYFGDSIFMNESLVRPPKGYDAENPAIEFLKLKSFVIRRLFSEAEITDASRDKEIIKTLHESKTYIDFLNMALD